MKLIEAQQWICMLYVKPRWILKAQMDLFQYVTIDSDSTFYTFDSKVTCKHLTSIFSWLMQSF